MNSEVNLDEIQMLVLNRILRQNKYKFDSEAPLGRGAFAVVYKVTNMVTGQSAALKAIPIQDSLIKEEKFKLIKLIEGEILIMKEVSGIKGMMPLYFSEITDHLIVLCMEYCPGGSLEKYVTFHDENKINESFLKYIFYQILCALFHLHQKGKVHRDIKPDNILISGDSTLLIADFGFAREMNGNSMLRSNIAGSSRYFAPETLDGIGQGMPSDVWAVGVVFLELTIGRDNLKNSEIYSLSSDLVKKKLRKFSKELIDVISSIFVTDPKNRPTFDDLLVKPFFGNKDFLKVGPVDYNDIKLSFNENKHRNIDKNEPEKSPIKSDSKPKSKSSIFCCTTIRELPDPPSEDIKLRDSNYQKDLWFYYSKTYPFLINPSLSIMEKYKSLLESEDFKIFVSNDKVKTEFDNYFGQNKHEIEIFKDSYSKNDQYHRCFSVVLHMCSQITRLKISSSNYDGIGFKYITDTLCHLKFLSRINFSINSIGDSGCTYLGVNLKNISNLEEITLSQNGITSDGAISFSGNLKYVPKLALLGLSYNNIGDKAIPPLLKSIAALDNIKIVTLQFNELTHDIMPHLESSLSAINSLQQFSVDNNKLEVFYIEKLKGKFGHIKFVQ